MKVKLSLPNEEFKQVYDFLLASLVLENQEEPILSAIEFLVITEIRDLIYEKNFKPIITIKLFPCQAYILFNVISRDSVFVCSMNLIQQIEKQLFQSSELGFQLLSKYKYGNTNNTNK